MLRVEIRWIDSGTWYSNGWESREQIVRSAALSEVSTVGWLMEEDEDTYYVASSHDPTNGHFYGLQLIHKSAVTAFIRLRARTVNAAEEE